MSVRTGRAEQGSFAPERHGIGQPCSANLMITGLNERSTSRLCFACRLLSIIPSAPVNGQKSGRCCLLRTLRAHKTHHDFKHFKVPFQYRTKASSPPSVLVALRCQSQSIATVFVLQGPILSLSYFTSALQPVPRFERQSNDF